MNIKDLKASLPYLFKAQLTAFLWGHSGLGKTSVVKKYAEDNGLLFFALYLGTQSDIGDILGLASFVKDQHGSEIATTFATPLWLKNAIDYCNDNPDKGAVIFLDEFNRGRRDIMNGMFSLALDKRFHNIQLPSNCYIIAAGNPPTDEYQVNDLGDTALLARFAHIKLEPSFNEWVDYAKEQKIESTLVSFLQEQPQLLEEPKSEFNLPVKVDRRAYERLNRLFAVGTPMNLLEQIASGIIGTERLVAYKLHLTNQEKGLSGEDVLTGNKIDTVQKWANPVDIKASLLSVTCDNVFGSIIELGKTAERLSDEQSDNFTKFLETLPRDLSYALLKRLMKEESAQFKVFKNYVKDDRYSPRLTAIVHEAKGMTPVETADKEAMEVQGVKKPKGKK